MSIPARPSNKGEDLSWPYESCVEHLRTQDPGGIRDTIRKTLRRGSRTCHSFALCLVPVWSCVILTATEVKQSPQNAIQYPTLFHEELEQASPRGTRQWKTEETTLRTKNSRDAVCSSGSRSLPYIASRPQVQETWGTPSRDNTVVRIITKWIWKYFHLVYNSTYPIKYPLCSDWDSCRVVVTL